MLQMALKRVETEDTPGDERGEVTDTLYTKSDSKTKTIHELCCLCLLLSSLAMLL
jgi:hypothetical protein